MDVSIRIYRTHDYDLMSLHHTGAIAIRAATKRALLAYYRGEYFQFTINRTQDFNLSDMPVYYNYTIHVSDKEAPGIEKWLSGFVRGSRNCCIKGILRHYLSDPCVAFCRMDGLRISLNKDNVSEYSCLPVPNYQKPVMAEVNKRNVEEMTGSEWVDSVAESRLEKTQPHGPKPRDVMDILNEKSEEKDEKATFVRDDTPHNVATNPEPAECEPYYEPQSEPVEPEESPFYDYNNIRSTPLYYPNYINDQSWDGNECDNTEVPDMIDHEPPSDNEPSYEPNIPDKNFDKKTEGSSDEFDAFDAFDSIE